MKEPAFSIITATHNSASYLSDNLESVRNQVAIAGESWEHIFVDAHSQDRTLEMIEEYKRSAQYPVRIIKQPPRGISAAFNTGIALASGECLFFLNSDDSFFDPAVLKDSWEFMSSHPDLDWFYGKIQVIEADNKPVGAFPSRFIFQIASKLLLPYFNFIPHQAVGMRRRVFDEFGFFDNTLASKMDFDLWLRIRLATNWTFFDRTIARFRVHDAAKSSGLKGRQEGEQLFEQVQARYLSRQSLLFAKATNHLLRKYNKMYR